MSKIVLGISAAALIGLICLAGCNSRKKTIAREQEKVEKVTMLTRQIAYLQDMTNMLCQLTNTFVSYGATVTNTFTVTNEVARTNVASAAVARAKQELRQKVDVTITGNTTGGVFPVIVQQQGDKPGEKRDQTVSIHIVTQTNQPAVAAAPTNCPTVMATNASPTPGCFPVPVPTAQRTWKKSGPTKTDWGQQQVANTAWVPQPLPVVPPPTVVVREYNSYPSRGYYVPRYDDYGYGSSLTVGLRVGSGGYGSYRYGYGGNVCSTGGRSHRSRH